MRGLQEGAMADKVLETLIDILKQALAEPGEQRLYRSGKLDGLFAGRTGVNAEAAERALREGLLEVVRTEAKGKVTTEWVRATPRAAEFLQSQASPVEALKDLRAVLQVNRQGVPLWLAEMRGQLQTLQERLASEAERWTHCLDALAGQVEAALRRANGGLPAAPESPNGPEAGWAVEALAYLDRRRASGKPECCPLPELFAAVREPYPNLSITAFHEGLRRLRDRGALRLLPYTSSAGDVPEPEYILLDGANLLYLVDR
jgi:hypothetical protein